MGRTRCWVVLLVLVLQACVMGDDVVAQEEAPAPDSGQTAPAEPSPPELLPLTGDVIARESFVIEVDGVFYLFHTGPGIPTKTSEDLQHWEAGPTLFDEEPEWIAELVPGVVELWAPHVTLFGGTYHLYYGASTFASARSCIGHATSEDPTNHEWTDRGPILCSNVDDTVDDWNAIDPYVVVTSDQGIWLAFGSFMSGIHMIELDPETGDREGEAMHPLAARRDALDAVQAPVLFEYEGQYYLFTSIDFCCRGANSDRSVNMGRSPELMGPYVDRTGTPLLEGGGTPLLQGDERWRGPGGSTVFFHEDRAYHVYHAYDAEEGGFSRLRIAELVWDSDRWPVSAGP